MIKKSIGSGRGSVYNVLLKALQSGDKYAYEICKEIEEKTNGAYILKEQSSYSGLKRLEQRDEITSYWKDSALGGRRHYYSLTEKGRQRIENSNFSWEDTRDEIVDNLFEKSEIEKTIDSASTELNEIKESISIDNQNEIDDIINQTNALAKENIENENQNNSEELKEIDNNESEQTDLFSIFSNYTDENKNYELTKNENQANAKINVEDNKVFEDTENGKNENEQINFDVIHDINEQNNDADDIKTENQESINQFHEEKTEYDELIKNLKTVEENTNKFDDDFNQNNQIHNDNLKKNVEDIETYKQLHKGLNNYVDETYSEKSYFSDSNYKYKSANEDINEKQNTDNQENLTSFDSEKLYENQNEIKNNEMPYSKPINYQDIFGDLISKDDLDEKSNYEYDDETFEKSNNSQYENNNFDENEDLSIQQNYSTQNDINRTLISGEKSRYDEIYEMQSQYNDFPSHEYFDNKNQNNFSNENQKIDAIHNVSFDKKFNNLENELNVPNYKIRYQKKSSNKRQSRFVLSNKLNLITSLIICMFLTICNTFVALLCKSIFVAPNSQILFCNVFYLVVLSILLYRLTRYIINPTKRTHNISKTEKIISISISVAIIALTFMLNIYYGMSFTNVYNYFASLIMPLLFAISIVLTHVIKKILAKNSKFY